MRVRFWIAVILVGGTLLGGQETAVWQGRRLPAGANPAAAHRENPMAPNLEKSKAESGPTPALLPGVPSFSEYQIGAEDLLSVVVMDAPEFSRIVRVSGAGTIKLPLIKSAVEASGKTTAELEREIAQALIEEGLLRQPWVTVSVAEFHSKPVSVSGAVRTPVVFQATRPVSLLEAISRAGGLSETASQEISVSFPARDGNPSKVVRVSSKSVTEVADPESNIWLRGGEDVRVPSAGRVYILGGVNRPGALLINNDEPLTLLKALALAGGTVGTASSKAFLLRASAGVPQKQEIALNLKKLLKRQAPDLPLESNDVVFIPDSKTKRITASGASAAMSSLAYALVGVLVWR